MPQEAREKVVPTIATPEGSPDQAVMAVCYPESHQSPISATHPYWEYLQGTYCQVPAPLKNIRHSRTQILTQLGN